jgi:hypothetical protein
LLAFAWRFSLMLFWAGFLLALLPPLSLVPMSTSDR